MRRRPPADGCPAPWTGFPSLALDEAHVPGSGRRLSPLFTLPPSLIELTFTTARSYDPSGGVIPPESGERVLDATQLTALDTLRFSGRHRYGMLLSHFPALRHLACGALDFYDSYDWVALAATCTNLEHLQIAADTWGQSLASVCPFDSSRGCDCGYASDWHARRYTGDSSDRLFSFRIRWVSWVGCTAILMCRVWCGIVARIRSICECSDFRIHDHERYRVRCPQGTITKEGANALRTVHVAVTFTLLRNDIKLRVLFLPSPTEVVCWRQQNDRSKERTPERTRRPKKADTKRERTSESERKSERERQRDREERVQRNGHDGMKK